MVRAIRGLGWTLIAAGTLILLYVVYLLMFTNLETSRAQAELLERFELDIGPIELAMPGEPAERSDRPAEPVDAGNAYAAIWFERPGSEDPVVRDGPLFVVEGVSLDVLRRGPGHYPDSAAPGRPGNFAISGHRTTYGAPFYRLDELEPGDLIHVVDRAGERWVYEVREQRIVAPTAMWVVGSDPLGTGVPTMTLTTCHPRFSAAQRLIVFAELLEPSESAPDSQAA